MYYGSTKAGVICWDLGGEGGDGEGDFLGVVRIKPVQLSPLESQSGSSMTLE